MTKINKVGVISLINILNSNFNGNKEAMANYIKNNLPISIEQMVKNQEFKEKSKIVLAEVQRIFANSRKVEFTSYCISNKKAHLTFKADKNVGTDYFKRKLGKRVDYKSMRVHSWKNEVELILEL